MHTTERNDSSEQHTTAWILLIRGTTGSTVGSSDRESKASVVLLQQM